MGNSLGQGRPTSPPFSLDATSSSMSLPQMKLLRIARSHAQNSSLICRKNLVYVCLQIEGIISLVSHLHLPPSQLKLKAPLLGQERQRFRCYCRRLVLAIPPMA